jgi:ERCC4-type nuclease
MFHIIVDDRERAIFPYLEQPAKASQISYEIRRINVGDYAICCDKQIKMIIERKTWEDLAASFRDGRKANVAKLISARQETGCILTYLIEGPACPRPNALFGRIPINNLRAHLDHLALRDNIHIIYSSDLAYSGMRLFELAKNMRSLTPRTETNSTPQTPPCVTPNESNSGPHTNNEPNSEPHTACSEPHNEPNTTPPYEPLGVTPNESNSEPHTNNEPNSIPQTPVLSNIEVLQTTRHSAVNIQIQMLQCLPAVGSIVGPLLYSFNITIKQIMTLKPDEFMAKFNNAIYPDGRSLKKVIAKLCQPISLKTATRIIECIPSMSRANAGALLQVIEFSDLFINFDINILADVHGTHKIGQARAKKIYDICYGEKAYL